MAILGPKPWVNPFGKMSIFRILEILVFIAYKGAFSLWIIVKVIFLTNIALKKRLEKWPYWDLNHGLTPLKKCQFFDFQNFRFYCLDRRFFNLEYRKSHYSNLQCLKKNVAKMAIFGPKPWVNPFGKCPFFDIMNFLFLQPRKALFRSRIS